jgi:hypothetical protein
MIEMIMSKNVDIETWYFCRSIFKRIYGLSYDCKHGQEVSSPENVLELS